MTPCLVSLVEWTKGTRRRLWNVLSASREEVEYTPAPPPATRSQENLAKNVMKARSRWCGSGRQCVTAVLT